MKELFVEIERVLPDGGDWCSLEKATTLAALVVGMRPRVLVEIGVWRGGSMIPMALAMKHVRKITGTAHGQAIAIDPWSPAASVAEQEIQANVKWWSEVDHEDAHKAFIARVVKHELTTLCTIVRAPSDQVTPPEVIDLLHIDGNHGPQAVRDVERFATKVAIGGILVLDDVGWDGGHVANARQLANQYGFVQLYELGSGIVMKRT